MTPAGSSRRKCSCAGPNYRGIWISIGIKVVAGLNDAPVRKAVKQAIVDFLAPLPAGTQPLNDDPSAPPYKGWPLNKPLIDLELATVAGRVAGVDFVQPPVLLAEGASAPVTRIDMANLDLPRILGISVTSGAPLDLDGLRGLSTAGAQEGPPLVRVPFIPEECR